MKSSELARDERENTKVTLDRVGSVFSWLQLCPRFKIDRDGDRILSGAEAFLRVVERSNEYIHRADRDPLPGREREINCSLEASSLRLSIFQSSLDAVEKNILLASQIVYITDPETGCNLSVVLPKVEELESEPVELEPNTESEFFHSNGDIILTPETDDLPSTLFWVIESSTLTTGGPFILKTDKIRFKNLNTNRYLRFLITRDSDEDGFMTERVILTTTLSAASEGTLFNLTQINSTSKYLTESRACQLGHFGVWIERGEVLDEGNYVVQGTRDKLSAVNLILNRVKVGIEEESKDDGKQSSKSVSLIEPLDAFVGLSQKKYFRKFYHMTTIPRGDSVSTIWPSANRGDLEFFLFLVQKTVFFSQGFAISQDDVQLGIDKAEAILCKQRQNLMRDQGILEFVLRTVNKLIPITKRYEIVKENANNKKHFVSEAETTLISSGQLILSKCFDLIYYCIVENPENQIYVADFLPVLLAHLNSQPLAGKCVTEMLSKNMELQETKIKAREIQIFVDKLRSSKMNAMYLNLLQACCSCEGDGVDANQAKIATMLFSNTNDIIIFMTADYNRMTPTKWINGNSSIYISLTPIPGSPIRGDLLLSKGLPTLSLNWTTNSIDFSPLGLFGKLSVNVADLFKTQTEQNQDEDKGATKGVSNKRKQAAEQKAAIASYFVAEMFLGAEMCMQRNYIGMHKLDPLFPYEMLVTVLKMDVTNNLKSAAVRLLMCQHIDRDPQAQTKIPALTRAWSDIEKHDDPQLPYVESARRYMFGIVQQILSDHVKAMAGQKWDDLSQHMLKLLRTMAEYNFYGTTERMNDVVGPLIKALDRRKMDTSAPESNHDVDENPVSGADQAPGESVPPDEGEKEESNEVEVDNAPRPKKANTFRTLSRYLSFRRKNVAEEEEEEIVAEEYSPPARYSKAPIYELQTMVEAVDILNFAQTVIEDRNISLVLRYFYAWHSGSENRTPAELFEQAMIDSKKLTLGIEDFDDIMIDVLMYVHTPLIQSSLEVLMAHHSKRKSLLDNLQEVQLLASHGRERQFRIVEQMLMTLEQNAETQELWVELETEADQAINKQTKDILRELAEICRIKRVEIDFDSEYKPDKEIQTLYCNLGCLPICMKVLELLESAEEDEDGNIGASGENTKENCRLCNELLYWFFLDNPKNQEDGYEELHNFFDTLDDDINSHLVIPAIFSNNESLMKRIPHTHINDLVDKIVKNEKSHRYLTLFPAMCYVGSKNIAENQLEIVKSLTSPGRLQKLVAFFVPVDHPEYEEKKELMKPYLNTRNVTLEDLPPLLSYYIKFVETLSSCTAGTQNISIVEAKVQSVMSYVDIIDSVLDPDAILLVKIKQCEFLFNSFIEVELKVPGLENAASIWKLLEYFKLVLSVGKDEIVLAEKQGLQSAQVNRQRIEFVIVAIKLIHGFFSYYHDANAFRPQEPQGGGGGGKFHISTSHIDDLIAILFSEIKAIYDLGAVCLSKAVKSSIVKALEVLSKGLSSQTNKLLELKSRKDYVHSSVVDGNSGDDEDDLGHVQDFEQEIVIKYKEFLKEITDDSILVYKADNENVAFISLLEKLPFIADPVDAEVRYESFIKKLVFHIRENIKIVNNRKQMDPRITATSRWIIRAFRTMIENRMGMSILERDDYGGEEQDNAAAPVVNALNTCGATALCLDLIADGIDESLQLEAIKLGVGLLFKEGGALEVQTLMNSHLRNSNSELFFKQVRLTVQKLQAWSSWNKVIILQDGAEPRPPDEVLFLRFLQLMCEGHYLPNQDILRDQPFNSRSYNVLDDFANYLDCLVRLPCRTSSVIAIRLTALILEVLQGPCSGNQAHFTLNTELVETLNRLNRSKVVNDCQEEEEVKLKKSSIDILQALLEGQGDKSVVFEKLLSVLHLDIIQFMSKNIMQGGSSSVPGSSAELMEEKSILKTECVVLLLTLCNFRPSLYDELGISRRVEDIVGSGTAMIEVIWRNDIHRRFFHVPRICDYLSKSSKDNLIDKVDRSNAENKLIDFLNRSHDLYREVKHQQLLVEMNLSKLFNLTNKDRASWVAFIIAFVVNSILLFEYKAYGSDLPNVAAEPARIITILDYIQAGFAFIVLLQNLVVRVPVMYQKLKDTNLSQFEVVFYTAAEPMTLYYLGYLAFVLLGTIYSYSFLPFLLLDIIVKNSTTQDVLNAVIFPRKQIAVGGVIILFIMMIYATILVRCTLLIF